VGILVESRWVVATTVIVVVRPSSLAIIEVILRRPLVTIVAVIVITIVVGRRSVIAVDRALTPWRLLILVARVVVTDVCIPVVGDSLIGPTAARTLIVTARVI
jgi:hypothetical protein